MQKKKVSIAKTHKLKIRFNPKKDIIHVQLNNWEKPVMCNIYDENNDSVYSCVTNVDKISIDVCTYKTGVYALKVENNYERKIGVIEKK